MKNVTGRLLVRLRWWNVVQEDGSNKWIFESCDDPSTVRAVDRRVFWGAQYLAAAAWAVFSLSALLKLNLQWLPVCCVALALNGAQLYGYNKCSDDAKQRVGAFVGKQMKKNSGAIYSHLGQVAMANATRGNI